MSGCWKYFRLFNIHMKVVTYFFGSFNKSNYRFVEIEALGSIMEYTGDLWEYNDNIEMTIALNYSMHAHVYISDLFNS